MKQNARDTLELVQAGVYTAPSGHAVDFRAHQQAAEAGTRLVTPDAAQALVEGIQPRSDQPPVVEVRAATTQLAAHALVADGADDLLLLNFASGRNPGGGFLNGARAQEEDLCRCSGLYVTLAAQRAYYTANRAQRSTEYTDHAIYSPRVPFFRTSGRSPLLEQPFLASVVTMPAPNVVSRKNPKLSRAMVEAAFRRRWRIVLSLAAAHGHRTVLLGAWGCGAFGNAAAQVAVTAAEAVADPRFHGHFDRIVFAIPDKGRISKANLAVFQRTLLA